MEPLTQEHREQVARVLDEAVALMNDSGAHWIKGTYSALNDDGEEAFCSVGAIWAAKRKLYQARGIGEFDHIGTLAIRALANAYYPRTFGAMAVVAESVVTSWNDRSDTTWEKVVKRFDRAKKLVLSDASL